MLVTESMKKYYAHQAIENDEEWNTKTLHVSDLGFCSTQIWARRNGKNTYFVDPDARRKMAFGKLWEQEVADSLRFAGVDFTEQVEVKGTLFGVNIECHIDFDIPSKNKIIEAKNTVLFKKVTNTIDVMSEYYQLQAAAGAMLLQRETFDICVADRSKGAIYEMEFKTADFTSKVEEAIMQRKFTGIGEKAPKELQPKYDWECKSCAFAACPNNKNPFLQVIS